MNRRSVVGTMLERKGRVIGVVVTMICALVAITAAFDHRNKDSRGVKSELMTSRIKFAGTSFYYPGQSSEKQYYTITLVNASLSTTSDISDFLRNPVNRLRQQGIAVPPASERHWKALTVALRRLANPGIPPGSTARDPKESPNLKSEIVRLQIPGGWISVAGDLGGGGNSFLADSVGYLRKQGVNIPSADEPAWRELAAALKALRVEYANPRMNGDMERQSSDNSESTATKPKTRIGLGLTTKQTTRDQLAREIRQRLISRGVEFSEQEVQSTATRALDLISKAKDPERGVIYVHTKKFTFCASWGKDKAFCKNQ